MEVAGENGGAKENGGDGSWAQFLSLDYICVFVILSKCLLLFYLSVSFWWCGNEKCYLFFFNMPRQILLST